MSRDDPITYEDISRSMMRSRLSLKPISSALSKGLAAMVSGGRDFHLKVHLMGWIYLFHLKIVLERCVKK
jgi:hypothetical protein